MSFLDKICIDQEDEARKSAGIASLGAFLASSNNFVVLFSPEYFTRLWCCYELAAFYQVKGLEKQKIVFVPGAVTVHNMTVQGTNAYFANRFLAHNLNVSVRVDDGRGSGRLAQEQDEAHHPHVHAP